MITPDNYLNIVPILVNEVIGGPLLSMLLGCIAVTYLSIVNNLPTTTVLSLNAIWILLFLSIYYNQFLLAIVILLIGVAAYTAYSNWANT